VIAFSSELVSQGLVEGEALLRAHWEEVALYQDRIALSPDYDQYRKLEVAGKLLICTARDDGKLIGYGVFFVHRGIHYSQNIFGVNDVFYVSPDYRLKVSAGRTLIAVALLDYAEQKLKALGVSVVTLRIKVQLDWSGLAERCGYPRVEYVNQKFIG